MFRWLSGLPYSLYQNDNSQRGVVQAELRLADPGTQDSLPAGAKWGAKIDDGTMRCVRRSSGLRRTLPLAATASRDHNGHILLRRRGADLGGDCGGG
jgi:hypothetical protein